MKRTALALAALVAASLLPAAVRGAGGEEYRIGPKDLLDVKVFEVPELNVERRVSDAGDIDLPLLGDFPVAGLTAREAAGKLEELLKAKYVNRASVSILIKDFESRPISVLGAVAKPGSLTVSGNWTLLQAISAAGGLTPQAGKRIYVLRRADNSLSDTLELSTDDVLQSASTLWNVPIYPSDVINVPAKTTVKVFCLGEVKTPGALEFDGNDPLTLLAAIAKAGGLTDRASKTIHIQRRRPDGKTVELVAHYRRIVSGREKNLPLEPGDVVIVKESFL
ncbi:MAG TPA: polysaccharide biosynthesis/export family protein [Thermoanaerobaculia bacterium]|nr:polysaccharide biosynthesis/export family protein [Thermoanaerobaculia bacterium]